MPTSVLVLGMFLLEELGLASGIRVLCLPDNTDQGTVVNLSPHSSDRDL